VKKIPRTNPKYALDSRHDTVEAVRLGETFEVETHDCRTGTITRPDQVDELRDTRFINPATGPISIRGVTAGSVICVEIIELDVDSAVGLMVTRPGVTGLEITKEPQLRIVTCTETYADLGTFRVPITPMIGLIGVAPEGDPVSTFRGGEHGGNMDTVLIRAGSRVFLRTFFDGGMLYFGDVHAAMGDGEVFLSGIEVAGRIEARVTVPDQWSLPTPLVETGDVVAVIAAGATLDEAARAALAKAVEMLIASDMNPVDAGYLMSAVGNLRVSQFLPGASMVHCRFELPKSVLASNQITLLGLAAKV
jgi:amidase